MLMLILIHTYYKLFLGLCSFPFNITFLILLIFYILNIVFHYMDNYTMCSNIHSVNMIIRYSDSKISPVKSIQIKRDQDT